MIVAKPSLPQFHLDLKPTPALYVAVGLEAGAVMDFIIEAWVNDPLKAVLRRIGGFARAASGPTGSTPKQR
jgi:hypothetical protein